MKDEVRSGRPLPRYGEDMTVADRSQRPHLRRAMAGERCCVCDVAQRPGMGPVVVVPGTRAVWCGWCW